MKVSILGAGIAGLSCASILGERGFEVTVFEKEDRIGGLCRSELVEGYIFDLHGGHIFNSKYDHVRDWVFSKLDKNQWQYNTRNTKILYSGRLMSYPFELALSEIPIQEAVDCLVDFVEPKGEEPDNYHDWLIWNFGKSIADKYMIPYNSKIWAYPLKEMSTAWVKGKMPLPTNREVIAAALTADPKEREMPHSTFYYPLQGGIQTLIDAIAKEIPDIRCSVPVESLEFTNGKWTINGEYQSDHVISTIPLKELVKVLDMPDEVKKAVHDLKFRSLTTTICEASHTNGLSWLYIPSKEYKAHRLVYQGNFAPGNCPQGKSSAVVETIGRIEPEKYMSEFKQNRQVEELELGNIIDTSFTQYAYMVFDRDYPRNIQMINSYLGGLGLTLLGRFAEWKYYNMDVCIKRAFHVASIFEEKPS